MEGLGILGKQHLMSRKALASDGGNEEQWGQHNLLRGSMSSCVDGGCRGESCAVLEAAWEMVRCNVVNWANYGEVTVPGSTVG